MSKPTMMMMAVVVLVLLQMARPVLSSALPPNCDFQPEARLPSDCTYGTTHDLCGRAVCLKGPGEMCGGRFGRYGRCANGLMCSNCNRCQGCSFQTFICWDDKDCIW